MRKISIMLLALFAGVQAAYSAKRNVEKPNIIYILADDMGIGDVKAYNKDGKIPTPNIDRIAHEGVMFTDAHTNSSVCTPTRYGILTGRYAWRTRLKEGVLGGHSPHLIDTNRETLASLLKKQGYATACVGKWHLGMDWTTKDGELELSGRGNTMHLDMKAPLKNGPNVVGFDYYFGIAGSLNMNPHVYIENEYAQGTFEYHKTRDDVTKRGLIQPANPGWIAKEFEQEEVLTKFAEKACGWIEQNAEKPFFLYFPLPSPHSPIVPRDEYKGKSKLNNHGDFCMETDWVVGEVLKTLDKLNLNENTLIVYTSDNGTSPNTNLKAMQEMGHYTVMNYRGLKGTLWEGGHRVPFIVRWPKSIKAGTESKEAICTTDMLATCADILGVELEDHAAEDSYSFQPALKGKKLKHNTQRMIVHHSDNGFFSVRQGKWKLSFKNDGGSRRRNPKDKPVINNSEYLLFDMENDPEESTNLYAENPEVVTQLKKELATMIRNGRSTPGAKQPTDLNDPKLDWPQIELIMEN